MTVTAKALQTCFGQEFRQPCKQSISDLAKGERQNNKQGEKKKSMNRSMRKDKKSKLWRGKRWRLKRRET